MKKNLALVIITSLIISTMSFIPLIQPAKTTQKEKITPVNELTCNCTTAPANVFATRSGGTVTVTWSGSYDSYSIGGYFSCGGTFNYCATGNSYSFPASCGGTLRITGNCGTTTCTNATCSSNPSVAATF